MSSETGDIYKSLLEAGFSKEEINIEIKNKTKEFQGFISERGALFLIAKENGFNIGSSDIPPELFGKIEQSLEQEIDYDEFIINISDISEAMFKLVILGRIGRIFKVRTFTRKDGTPGVVGSFLAYDNSGVIKIVLWGEHAKIMEADYFQNEELIRIIGGYSKMGLKEQLEVHLGKKGRIILAPEDVNPKKIPDIREILYSKYSKKKKVKEDIKIDDLYGMDEGFIDNIKGIVDSIEEFKEWNNKEGEKSFLLKFTLKDDTSSVSVIVWGLNAVNCLKLIDVGDKISLSNILYRADNSELQFVKNSKLIKI